jgi:hypothetical protein
MSDNTAADEHGKRPGISSWLNDQKDAAELDLSSSTVWHDTLHTAALWGQFKHLKLLDLNNNGLTTLPSCLDVLSSLDILFLSENNFETIPECIGNMQKLRVLSLRGNRLTTLSSSNLPSSSLVWLILTNNRIRNIHSNVRDLVHLRKLMLSHNQLTSIPMELGECKNLELIRLANNEISVPLPREFLTLPKLAWISLAGNPILRSPQTTEKIIPKSSVSFDESVILGRGASGTVFLGKYKGKDVAVKVFKQESMGSDGTAADEAAINGLINHSLAVSAHGIFLSDKEGPSTHEGMVMELIEGAEALGKVPSFQTVTRDASPSDSAKNLSRDQVLSVVWNVATCLEHVHSSARVVNGDIYLHNILQCGDGNAKVSDWGASFVYDGQDKFSRKCFEAIEGLAFARLVQDLFDWHLGTALPDLTEPADFLGRKRGATLLEKGPFYDLMSSLLQPCQSERPSFGEIVTKLSAMQEFEFCAGAPDLR